MRGAEPGDLLELEVLGYETDDFGWTAIWPGSGFLGDLFDRPFLARWELAGGVARSEQLPGVAVPACVHAGTIGVAPSAELFERAREREAAIDTVNPPSPEHAWPPEAADGLRTYPPRENGGNMDIRDLGPGARLWLPVHVPGALLSVGDLHFAQGDGEVCVSAIETGGAATFRVGLRRRRTAGAPASPATRRRRGRRARCSPPPASHSPTTARQARPRPQPGRPPRPARAARWLEHERGLEREPAYVLMSVAAELRVSELVDAPNPLVSAALPLDVFEDAAVAMKRLTRPAAALHRAPRGAAAGDPRFRGRTSSGLTRPSGSGRAGSRTRCSRAWASSGSSG